MFDSLHEMRGIDFGTGKLHVRPFLAIGWFAGDSAGRMGHAGKSNKEQEVHCFFHTLMARPAPIFNEL